MNTAQTEPQPRNASTLVRLLGPPIVALALWASPGTGPTLCPFALMTGYACPLCGGTRAASALLRGDLATAWNLHPLVYVVIPIALLAWLDSIGVRWVMRVRRVMSSLMFVAVAMLFLGVWALRAWAGRLPAV